MPNKEISPAYKWYLVILGGLTNALVVAVQTMSLSVLLPEITVDLGLSIFQAGLIWGLASLPAIVAFIVAGILIDRFGPKRILIFGSLIVGVFGALRGFSNNYPALIATVVLFGLSYPLISLANVKNTKIWFDEANMGLANGFLAVGMALGFFIGSMVSASVVSPWLGGWRYTFFFYGLIAILLVIPWILTHNPPKEADITRDGTENHSALESIRHIAKIRNIWLLSLAMMCFNGAVQGFLGYLPLYLRNTGWQAARADGLAATFHLASMIFAIPISFLSDKVRSRRKVLLFTISLTVLGIGSFFFFGGDILWAAVIAAGISRDGIMAVLITTTLETKGVGRAYSGIATGFILIFASIGGLISPPLGNHLATLRLNLPFAFWSVLCLGAVLCVFALKEYRKTTPDE